MVGLEWIRKNYDARARRNARVCVEFGGTQRVGIITGSRDYRLRVRIDGINRSLTFHPDDVKYINTKE
jgi:hypothetical protein